MTYTGFSAAVMLGVERSDIVSSRRSWEGTGLLTRRHERKVAGVERRRLWGRSEFCLGGRRLGFYSSLWGLWLEKTAEWDFSQRGRFREKRQRAMQFVPLYLTRM